MTLELTFCNEQLRIDVQLPMLFMQANATDA